MSNYQQLKELNYTLYRATIRNAEVLALDLERRVLNCTDMHVAIGCVIEENMVNFTLDILKRTGHGR